MTCPRGAFGNYKTCGIIYRKKCPQDQQRRCKTEEERRAAEIIRITKQSRSGTLLDYVFGYRKKGKKTVRKGDQVEIVDRRTGQTHKGYVKKILSSEGGGIYIGHQEKGGHSGYFPFREIVTLALIPATLATATMMTGAIRDAAQR